MIEILVLIIFIAIIGCIVAFAVQALKSMEANPIWAKLIYLLVAVALLVGVIHALRSGHLPSVRL